MKIDENSKNITINEELMNEKIEDLTSKHKDEIEKVERELNSHIKANKG